MTDGQGKDPAGRVPGLRAANAGDAGVVAEENATQETKDFICPYCRRAYDQEEVDAYRKATEIGSEGPVEEG